MKRILHKKIVVPYFLIVILMIQLTGCKVNTPELLQLESTIEAGSDYVLTELVSSDSEENVITVKEDNINKTTPGSYNVVFEVTTPKNKVYEIDMIFDVIDTTPPEITCEEEKEFEVGYNFDAMSNVTANDLVNGNVGVSIVSNNVDTSKEGSYIVEYSASDSSGNISNKSIKVEIRDRLITEEEYAVNILNKLKSVLKNPESLQVHNISLSSLFVGTTYVYEIDYSAQNGFGGMNREKRYLMTDNGFIEESDFIEEVSDVVKMMWSEDWVIVLDLEKILRNVK